jgi:hypothetical protein
MLQLPDISGPCIILEGLHQFLGDGLDLSAHLSAEFIHKMVDKQWDIIKPLTEGRNSNRENVQPVIQVLPKPSLLNFLS